MPSVPAEYPKRGMARVAFVVLLLLGIVAAGASLSGDEGEVLAPATASQRKTSAGGWFGNRFGLGARHAGDNLLNDRLGHDNAANMDVVHKRRTGDSEKRLKKRSEARGHEQSAKAARLSAQHRRALDFNRQRDVDTYKKRFKATFTKWVDDGRAGHAKQQSQQGVGVRNSATQDATNAMKSGPSLKSGIVSPHRR
ncbi:RxLR effector protein [Plasmodiophora brassicae]